MNVYDTANNLAEEIRRSDIYISLKNSRDKLFSDPEKKKLIEEFEQLKREVQIMELMKKIKNKS